MNSNVQIERVLRLEPTTSNARNSEGAIIELRDGKLFLAYTHFYGKGHKDESPAYIAGRYSEDKGKTWDSEDKIIIENEGKQNVMGVSLLRLNTGEIGLFYSIKDSPLEDCNPYFRKSQNEVKSFGEKVCCIPEKGYFELNNDRVVQLSSGRIMVPTAYYFWGSSGRGTSTCVFSDDGGKTWQKSKSELKAPINSKEGFQEPGIIELKNGSLMMWMRNDLGCQYISHSYDQGITWTEPTPSRLISPHSPASIKRIPSSKDLLCIYNDHSGRFPYHPGERIPDHPGERVPLVAAISSDEGMTWKNHKLIESDPEKWYCYTSITFVEDVVILGYCAGNANAWGLDTLQITRIKLDWLYE